MAQTAHRIATKATAKKIPVGPLKADHRSWHLRVKGHGHGPRATGAAGERRHLKAFVELSGDFQQFALGSALTLVRDFPNAEDVVQEAFVAAWSALPSLHDPGAFPG